MFETERLILRPFIGEEIDWLIDFLGETDIWTTFI